MIEKLVLILALILSSCGYNVTELGNSSGCLFTSGGPYGVTFGSVTVCRTGADGATVEYVDKERSILLRHGKSIAGQRKSLKTRINAK